MDQLDPTLIVATVVIAIVTWFFFKRVFVTPLVNVMEERQHLFEQAEERIAEAERLSAEAEQQSGDSLNAARASAEVIRREARDAAADYRRERLAEATAKAQAHLEAGRAQIAEARERDVSRLKEQATTCVDLACERLLGAANREAAAAAVDHALARRLH